ncbi:hypothetical protein [Pseudoalteromonas sp. MMG010]|uniref:hypothetical protein n=1 Tax=Pseudoalteromonas sp. MMG010 TaxID=2822685 RepID=UPI001FFC6F8C|nr:hypothetical protein [Pseudoalteromonas sp. MMG010]
MPHLVKLSLFFILILSHNAFAAAEATHIPGVFIGATHAQDETEFTYGIEYEYKFTSQWGAGVVYERADSAHHDDGVSVLLASVYYHPTKSIRLGVGFGEERIGGDHPHEEDLYRVSAAYDFHIGNFGLAPTLAVDFIDDEEAVVVGVALTRPF